MPIYEYQCSGCQHEFEMIQKMSDDPVTECPSCHKNEVKRLVSAAGFQLKGTGWYVTDFKDKGNAKKTKPADETNKKEPVAKNDPKTEKNTSKKGDSD